MQVVLNCDISILPRRTSESSPESSPVAFRWHPDDALVVYVAFSPVNEWAIGRDLLLNAPCDNGPFSPRATLGDVLAWGSPDRDVFILCLKAAQHLAYVEIPFTHLTRFLQATVDIVAPGQENLGIDEAIEYLLNSLE